LKVRVKVRVNLFMILFKYHAMKTYRELEICSTILDLSTRFFLLERLNLFATCDNTFSKWWEGLRMACRRVLSSTPLLVRGSETGGDSGE
jgi:hypothetical protein